MEDASGNEEHIGYNVVEPKADERECRPPDSHHLREVLASRESEETCKTNEPISTNASNEDLVRMRRDHFGCGKVDDFGLVVSGVECASVAGHYAGDEERTSKVAEECDHLNHQY